MLGCKICKGNLEFKCPFCGFKGQDKKQKDEEYRKEMKVVFFALKKAQAKPVTEIPDLKEDATETERAEWRGIVATKSLHDEIRRLFGDWTVKPTPVYVSPLRELLADCRDAERSGDQKKARVLYMRLWSLMTNTDRVDCKTRLDIQAKIKELTPCSGKKSKR